MPVASLVRVTFAFASTAPLGSATRPTMRPLAPCAARNAGLRRRTATTTQAAVQRARSAAWNLQASIGLNFCLKTTACAQPQPCYNPARLEKAGADCQGEKTRPAD